LEKAVMFTFNGEDTNVTPKIQVTFMKQLLTIFPEAGPRCPSFVAFMLVASSGALVPIAVAVAPMITGGLLKMRTICEAERARKLKQIIDELCEERCSNDLVRVLDARA
jgi:hypothetical protein